MQTITENKTLTIKAQFSTIAEAVKASGMDLSYNEAEAARTIRDMDSGRGGKVEVAYLMDDNSVLYVYKCDIRLLNEFEPFISCMDNSAFYPATVEGNTVIIHRNLPLPRNARKTIAQTGITVTTL